MGAEVFASPVALFVALLLVVGASAVHYQDNARKPVLSVRKLAVGYLAVVLACAVIAAFSSYVPFEEAVSRWHVSPENYWAVQIRSFIVEFVLMSCVALVGVAFIGVPIIFALGRRGLATIPNVLAASVVVSVLVALLVSSGTVPAFSHLWFTVAYVVGQHLLLALSFSLCAGLRWKPER